MPTILSVEPSLISQVITPKFGDLASATLVSIITTLAPERAISTDGVCCRNCSTASVTLDTLGTATCEPVAAAVPAFAAAGLPAFVAAGLLSAVAVTGWVVTPDEAALSDPKAKAPSEEAVGTLCVSALPIPTWMNACSSATLTGTGAVESKTVCVEKVLISDAVKW